MSLPSNCTRPSTRAPSIRSFIRFRTRRNVDLPQPDGPIRAVTEHSGMVSVIRCSAWAEPYQNDRSWTSNLVRVRAGSGACQPLLDLLEMMSLNSRDKGHLRGACTDVQLAVMVDLRCFTRRVCGFGENGVKCHGQ